MPDTTLAAAMNRFVRASQENDIMELADAAEQLLTFIPLLVKDVRTKVAVEAKAVRALEEAATVDTKDIVKGIHELTDERDAYRSALCDLVMILAKKELNQSEIFYQNKAIDVLRGVKSNPS